MNDVTALRKHLFDAIEGVKNKSMSIEQAKAIADISQTVINSAKVEVDYAKVTSGKISSGFLPEESSPSITHPALGHIVHRMR